MISAFKVAPLIFIFLLFMLGVKIPTLLMWDFQVNFAARVSLEITSTELSSQCQTESVSYD